MPVLLTDETCMKTRIRKAVPEDAAFIARVHVDTWRTAYADILPTEFLAGLKYADREAMWSNAVAADRPGANLLVAETEAGEIVGFVFAAPERDGNSDYCGEIYSIYVLQEHQGKGTGKQLFATAVRLLREAGYKSLILRVFQANLPARRFYESLGGEYLDDKLIMVGETEMVEAAYGWKDSTAIVLDQEGLK